ncbi:MAG: hypothetical protein R3E97_03385 [Candidatus Eisenbacteria bacterium]
MNEDADVQKMLSSVVLHKVDAEKGEGIELAKSYKVQGYPTFVMANAEVQPIDRWMGYSKSLLGEMLDESLADLSTVSEKRERFSKSPSAPVAVKLARYDESMGEYGSAVEFYEKAGSLDPEKTYAFEIFDATFSAGRRKAEGFGIDRTKKAADMVLASSQDGMEIIQVGQMMSYAAKQAGDETLAVPYIKTAVERTADSSDESVQKSRGGLLPTYALHVEKNPQKAVDLKKASMPEGWMDDAGQLNSYAWWAFENQVDLENAKVLAEKGVELAPEGKEKAQILDTLAEICNSLENCAEAVELTKLAIAQDPDSEFYKKQLARFQELLAAKQ